MYNTNKHDIEEMAKGPIGQKWPPPIHINYTSTKQIKHQKKKTKQTNKQTNKKKTKQTKTCPKITKVNQVL